MNPDFDSMSPKELRAYILNHRNDADAIHTRIKQILANPDLHWYSPEDADRFPEIYEEHRKRREAEREND